MIVICLEGCHGSGKTELCKRFESEGYWVLDEAFLDMPAYALHPQSLLMETTWVCSWFQRLLKHAWKERNKPALDKTVYIADRSPFSAVFYSRKGHLLERVIREQMREVLEAADIEIYTVLIKVDREILWDRILQRLKLEPERKKYNEDKREWMEETLGFYEKFDWDMVVHNNDITIPQLQNAVEQIVAARSTRFMGVLKRRTSSQASSPRSGSPISSGDLAEESDDVYESDFKESPVTPGAVEDSLEVSMMSCESPVAPATPATPAGREGKAGDLATRRTLFPELEVDCA